MTRRLAKPALVMFVALGFSACSTTSTDRPMSEAVELDAPPPEASALVESFCNTMSNLSSYHVVVHTWQDDIAADGMKLQFEKSISLDVRRPDTMRVEAVSDSRHTILWRNAESATILDTDLGLYSMLDYSGDIDSFVDHVATAYGLEMPLADILVQNPCEALQDKLADATYVGVSLVRGKPCHHLAFSGDVIDFQLWLPVEGPAYPMKMAIDHKTQEFSPQYTALFGNFRTSVDPEVLTVTLPEDAKKIEMIKIETSEGATP